MATDEERRADERERRAYERVSIDCPCGGSIVSEDEFNEHNFYGPGPCPYEEDTDA